MLCRLELALAAGADQRKLMQISKGLDHPDTQAEEIVIGVNRCIDRKEYKTAEYLMTLIDRRNQSLVAFAPQEIRLKFGLGNSAAVEDLFSRLLLYRSDAVIGQQLQLDIAEAFIAAGDKKRAGAIFRHFRQHFQNPTSPSQVFLESYLQFLTREEEYYRAREVLREAYRKSPPPNAGLLVALYEKWGRLNDLPGSVDCYDLTSGVIVDVRRLVSEKQAKKESLSDLPVPE